MNKVLYVGYWAHKTIQINSKLASPMLDSVILKDNRNYEYLVFDKMDGEELIESKCVNESGGIVGIFANQIKAGLIRWKDVVFLINLYRPNQHPNLIHPWNKKYWWIFAARNYFVARHYAGIFREHAKKYDEARVLVYYGARMLGVVMAFRKMNKMVYDVQHGYIGASHNAYNNSLLINSESNFEPSGYIIWGERFLKNNPVLGSRKIVYTDFAHLKINQELGKLVGKEKKCVLFSTQWETPLPKFLESLISKYKDILWVFRFHPFERHERDDVKYFTKYSNVEISERGRDLMSDFFVSDMQMTVNSSTVHEAAAIGKISLFTDMIGCERFADEISMGLAYHINEENVEEILKYVCHI